MPESIPTGGPAASGAGGRRATGRPRLSAGAGRPEERGQRRAAPRGGAVRAPEPPVPDSVSATDLPAAVRRALATLSPGQRARVGGHLAAAGALLDEDSERAYAHAAAARDIAARIAPVREAAGISAYRTGRWAEAARELAAYQRMTGDVVHLPVRADAERGLGRPERALALAASPEAAKLDRAGRVELRIVASGARRDLGQADAAVTALRGPELDDPDVQPWTARLWYAYADALLAAGAREEAARWFAAVSAIDPEGETDAAERAAALEHDDAGGG